MNIRILHCSTSLENYYLCLEHGVAGFGNRGPQVGDRVYLQSNYNPKYPPPISPPEYFNKLRVPG